MIARLFAWVAPAWLAVLSRSAAALLGGYLFSYAFTAALARLSPLDGADAVIVATLPSFAIFTFAILWAFAARSAWKAWLLTAWALPLAAVGFWPQLLERVA
ncbi:iron transporter [Pseudomonas sp. BN415]|uniref:iron transporter n=1 Tax=Pseudomonas sp. BN415 TaxID=2567889 RepID=UPI002454C99B|nr:iron transporter [Pseudomonas sp. BN415]MDH4585052.1 iron transporter [Pseudomonas sp. BN415]